MWIRSTVAELAWVYPKYVRIHRGCITYDIKCICIRSSSLESFNVWVESVRPSRSQSKTWGGLCTYCSQCSVAIQEWVGLCAFWPQFSNLIMLVFHLVFFCFFSMSSMEIICFVSGMCDVPIPVPWRIVRYACMHVRMGWNAGRENGWLGR